MRTRPVLASGISENREALELLYNTATIGEQILPLLDKNKPHLLHLSCHGTTQGLTLVDPDNMEIGTLYDAGLTLEDLRLAGHLRLVVFMECESAVLAERAVEHADDAIGMSEKVADEDAPVFSQALYAALAGNIPLQAAFDRACHAGRVRGGGYHIPIFSCAGREHSGNAVRRSRMSALMSLETACAQCACPANTSNCANAGRNGVRTVR